MNARTRCFALAALAVTLVPAISLAQKPVWTPMRFQPTVTPGPGVVARSPGGLLAVPGPVAQPAAAPAAPAPGPRPSAGPSVTARVSRPSSTSVVVSFDGGVVAPTAEAEDGTTLDLAALAELNLFVGAPVAGRDTQHGLFLGGQLRVDLDSSGMIPRLEVAPHFRWGWFYAAGSAGLGIVQPFEGAAVTIASVSTSLGIAFGDSGFYMAVPRAYDFTLGARNSITVSSWGVVLGYQTI